ncbi:MAG TPA: hypothetical protein VJK90_08545, partial [Acetobacteraceae bacterium]|nr:hypothetical protein [Acetobacteraceae bacterium]
QHAQRAPSFLVAAWRRGLSSTLPGVWKSGTSGEDQAISLCNSCPSETIPMALQRLSSFDPSLS